MATLGGTTVTLGGALKKAGTSIYNLVALAQQQKQAAQQSQDPTVAGVVSKSTAATSTTKPSASGYSLASMATSKSSSSDRKKISPADKLGASSSKKSWSVIRGGARQSTAATSLSGSSVWGGAGAGASRRRGGRPLAGDGVTGNSGLVRDEDGIDVTPKSLMTLRPTALMTNSNLADLKMHASSHGSRVGSSRASSSDVFERRSTLSLGLTDLRSMTESRDGSSETSSASSTPRSTRSSALSEMSSSRETSDKRREDDEKGSASQAQQQEAIVTAQKEEVEVVRDEDDVVEDGGVVTVKLSETETHWLLSIESYSIDEASPYAEEAKQRNQHYSQLCAKNKLGNESLVHREMQTSAVTLKHKELQTAPRHVREAGCQASESDIYQSCLDESVAMTAGRPALEQAEESTSASAEDAGAASSVPGGSGGSVAPHLVLTTESGNDAGAPREQKAEVAVGEEVFGPGGDQGAEAPRLLFDQEPGTWVDVDPADTASEALAIRKEADDRKFLASTGVSNCLRVIERAIQQNVEHELQALYRYGLPQPPAAPEGDPVAPLVELWKYKLPEDVAGLHKTSTNVSCIVWSPYDQDTLAVGYGEFDCTKRELAALAGSGGGLVLVWSISNIHFPEHIIPTPMDVTSLSFSTRHPSLLAAGLADGTVMVFDLSRRPAAVLAAPTASRHGGDPVWDVCWVGGSQSGEGGAGEALVSAGANGRVLQWGVRRGLEITAELMHLTAAQNPAKLHGKAAPNSGGGATALRHAGALSLDFSPFNRGVYLVGTEGGLVHRCASTYSDQYLLTYVGHVGPVVCVRWSPFSPLHFVTAGADWTLRLWEHDRGASPVRTLIVDPASRAPSTVASQSPPPQLAGTTAPPTPATPAKPTSHTASAQPSNRLRATTPGAAGSSSTSGAPPSVDSVPEFPNDVCWSPVSSTVLACAVGHSLQLWDLGVSTMDPVFTLPTASVCTAAAFRHQPSVLAVGCADGSVAIHHVVDSVLYADLGNTSESSQRDRLEAVLTAEK